MKKLTGLMKMTTRRKRSTLFNAFALAVTISVSLVADGQAQSAANSTPQSLQQNNVTTKAATKAKTYYTCPMHPEVKSAKQGKCPKCGMALRLAHAEPTPDVSEKAAANSEVHANEAVAASMPAVNKPAVAADSVRAPRKMIIPDVVVLDQDGKAVHFYSDLIKGKTVAINFIFTTCTTICPPLAATFARVQREMGDKVGRDVHFISISVDPVTDTPERLKAWGAKFKAGAGWTFVTGDKQEMDKLLSALGASVSRREDHSPTVIVGNDLKGIWTRTYGLAKTAQMVGLIQNVMEGKTDESLAREQD
jgi:cytochrome oxidase Cu insertion factor (SCO1/SenC/PrrC family)